MRALHLSILIAVMMVSSYCSDIEKEHFQGDTYVNFSALNFVKYCEIPTEELLVLLDTKNQLVFALDKKDDFLYKNSEIFEYVKELEEQEYSVVGTDGTTRSVITLENDKYIIEIFLFVFESVDDKVAIMNDFKESIPNIEIIENHELIYTITIKTSKD